MGGPRLPQGTLDLLILKTLALAPQHGWAVSERLRQISADQLQVTGWALPDDSLVEAIELPESEGYALGVLWHPEEDVKSAVIGSLVQAAGAGVKS